MSEFRSVSDYKIGRISGNTFQHREVKYAPLDELAVFEGDIVLGTVADIEAVSKDPEVVKLVPAGITIKGDQYRWPGGEIPYYIHPEFHEPERVTEAIRHWEVNTKIRFITLTSENFNQHPNRVLFISGDGCWSYVGMQGGEQFISLGYGCTVGNAIHEIGHTVGLWHEQSREDRDDYVIINYQNIQPGYEHNFNQQIADGDDRGAYDYDSIMHYPSWAFTRNNQPTIVAKNGASIGQRNGLSPGDISAVKDIYPNL